MSMADLDNEKSRVEDPAAAVGSTNHDEPLDSDSDGKDFMHITKRESLSHDEKALEAGDGDGKQNLARAKSYATTASAKSRIEDVLVERKQWYKRLNPLKWSAPPPVPETRRVSREYTASILSQLYFQWVAPIMSVSDKPLFMYNAC